MIYEQSGVPPLTLQNIRNEIRRRSPSEVYNVAIVVGLVVLLFGNVIQYLLSTTESGNSVVLIACALLCAPLALIHRRAAFAPHPLMVWALVFGIATVVRGWFGQDFRDWLEDVLPTLLFLAVLGATFIGSLSTISARVSQFAFLGATLMGVLFNFVEVLFPGTFSTVLGRAAGLYRDPNTSGFALIIGMLVSAPLLSLKPRIAFTAVIGLGVFVTQSRGAMIVWLIAVAVTALVMTWSQLNWRRFAIGTVTGLLMLVGSFVLIEIGASEFGWGERIASIWSSNTLEDQRVLLAAEGWERFLASPLTGEGVGTPMIHAGNEIAGPHNMGLSLGIQFGFVGFLLMIGLVAAVLLSSRDPWKIFPFVVTLTVVAMFTHTMLQEMQYAVAIGWVCATGGSSFRGKLQRSNEDELRC